MVTLKYNGKILNGSYVPAGRTSVTWYEGTQQLPNFTHYNMTGYVLVFFFFVCGVCFFLVCKFDLFVKEVPKRMKT